MLSLTAFQTDSWQSDAFQIETGRITVSVTPPFAADHIIERSKRDPVLEQVLREDEELLLVVAAVCSAVARTVH